jgi:HPt (histidine-containing phosphotransfer) domain-containing protein
MGEMAAGVEVSAKTLDRDLLKNLLALAQKADDDIIGELVDLFFEQSAPAHLERLAVAAAARDLPALAAAAHSLYGASASLGANRVASLCQQLEGQAGRAKPAETADLLGELEAELGRAQQAFREALAALTISPS